MIPVRFLDRRGRPLEGRRVVLGTSFDQSQPCRRLTTGDPELAHEWLRNCYVPHRAQLSGDVDRFSFEHTIADFGRFSTARLKHSMAMRAIAQPSAHVTVVEVIKGRYQLETGRSTTVTKGGIVLYPPDVALASGWPNITARVVQIRLSDLTTEISGPEATLRFDGVRPVSVPRSTVWCSLTQHVARELSPGGAAGSSELIRDGIFRLLAATLVQTFPIQVPAEPSVVADGKAPGVVRRAVAFVEANARRPIGVREIADAARVGPRGLATAFRRQLDTTPLGYLRRVRLEGAHQDLKVADPAVETVTGIAARWGFAHHGRFSQLYRARYRCPPSVTLRI